MTTMLRTLGLVLVAAIAACGGSGDTSANAAQQGTGAAAEAQSQTCSLLTDEQVATVVPGHDGGHDQDTSEASLMTDVAMGHCKYYHFAGTEMRWLDVLVYKASSDKGFENINIGKWAHHGSSRSLDIGDVGFLHDLSDTSIMATASKGRTVFELTLHSPEAAAMSEQLIELARIVMGKL